MDNKVIVHVIGAGDVYYPSIFALKKLLANYIIYLFWYDFQRSENAVSLCDVNSERLSTADVVGLCVCVVLWFRTQGWWWMAVGCHDVTFSGGGSRLVRHLFEVWYAG